MNRFKSGVIAVLAFLAQITVLYAFPTITAQPQSALVDQGASVTFSVTASGNGAVAYQWQKNYVNLSGQTGVELVLTNVQPGELGAYRVVVTDVDGNVVSDNANLSFNAPIITSGLNVSGTIGVPFTYAITANNGPTSYNAAGLPGGLSLDGNTGIISGTFSVTGTNSVSIEAISSSGTGAATLTIAVALVAPKLEFKQHLTTIHEFSALGECGPYEGLVTNGDGTFFGATAFGGEYGFGAVYKISSAGVLAVVHSFEDQRGLSMVTIAPDGTLYGITENGGTTGNGTVFKITASGSFSVLHEFDGTNGASPKSPLLLAPNGELYGTTNSGGSDSAGTVFRITVSGSFTSIHTFNGVDGGGPYGTLATGTDGNVYGSTKWGGPGDWGAIFRITPDDAVGSVFSFSGNGGANPGSSPNGLVTGTDGCLYGTTMWGGSSGNGTVFRVSTSGSFNSLWSFNGTNGGGYYPVGTLVQGADGIFYGLTGYGGIGDSGGIFRITATGELKTLHAFSGLDGAYPLASRAITPDGSLFGTTQYGGSDGAGTVFMFSRTCVGRLGEALQQEVAASGGAVTFTATGFPDGVSIDANGIISGTPATSGTFDATIAASNTAGSDAGTLRMIILPPRPKILPDGICSFVQTISKFNGDDGEYPAGGLVSGADGVLYGTARQGGEGYYGTVYAITLDGVRTTLCAFSGRYGPNLGSEPTDLLFDEVGNLWGTTTYGGSNNDGTLFKIPANGTMETIHSFDTSKWKDGEGSYPYRALVLGGTNEIFGTTSSGGKNFCGVVYKLEGDVLTTICSFSGQTGPYINSGLGSSPSGKMVRDYEGNLYGTTCFGGKNDKGTVFRITAGGSFESLWSFKGTDGENPSAGLLLDDSDGSLYGTTQWGGGGGNGTIFRLTGTVLTTLYSFSGIDGAYFGTQPRAELIKGPDGKIYGTTYDGGRNDDGTIFRFNPNGSLIPIWSFSWSNGARPSSALVTGSDGKLYGTTEWGGSWGGTVYRLTPPQTTFHTGSYLSYQIPASGVGPITYAATSLPAGLSLDQSSGVISGTPTEAGSAEVVVSASNPGGTTTTSLMMIIAGPPPGIAAISGTTIPTGAFSYQVTGTNATGYAASGLPEGLWIDSFTGLISGTPVTSGTFNVSVSANSSGGAVSSGFTFVVAPLPPEMQRKITTIYTFSGTDGVAPYGELAPSGDGFYGTTVYGGATYSGTDNGNGTVFRLTTSGSLTTLFSFSGTDGANPYGWVTLGPDGLYGTTSYGAQGYTGPETGNGEVFKMTTSGSVVWTRPFTGGDGSQPQAGLLAGNDGLFYGTTPDGGYPGVVFQVNTSGSLTRIWSQFGYDWDSDGAHSCPVGGLMRGSNGSLFGSTVGYLDGRGSVFELTPDQSLSFLYTFSYSDPAGPLGTLLEGKDGYLYGTARRGGRGWSGWDGGGLGSVFKLSTTGSLSWNYLFSGTDGANPYAGLTMGADGELYGTTEAGGKYGWGTLFTISSSGSLRTLATFNGANGTYPKSRLVMGGDGQFYGTTSAGGTFDKGTVFSIPSGIAKVGMPFQYPLAATNNPTSFGATNLPAWLTLDSSTGVISGTPSESDAGTYQITVSATNEGGTGSETIPITVLAPIVINPIPAQHLNEQTPMAVPISASVLEAQQTVTFALGEGTPVGVSVENLTGTTGMVSWTPAEEQGPGTHSITVKARDPNTGLAVSKTFQVTVDEVNLPPHLDPIPKTPFTPGTTLDIELGAWDEDRDVSGTKQVLQFGLEGSYPAGASVDSGTAGAGRFHWDIPANEAVVRYEFSVSVSDGIETVSQPVVISSNDPPVFSGTAPVLTIEEGAALSFSVSATDPNAGQTITYSLINPPAGAQINTSSGAVTWTPDESYGGQDVQIRVRVTDNGPGNLYAEQVASATVIETNKSPVLEVPANVWAEPGASIVQFIVRATDADVPANTLTYSLASGPGSMDPSTGAYSWSPDWSAITSGSCVVRVRVSDGFSPIVGADEKDVTVILNTPPAIQSLKFLGADVVDGLLVTESGNFQLVAVDDQGIAQVEIFAGSASGTYALPVNRVSDQSYQAFWAVDEIRTDGTFSIKTVVTDPSGLVTSRTNSVTVGLAAPGAPVIRKPVNNYDTNTPDLIVSGSAPRNSTVHLFINGDEKATATASVTGDFAANITLIPSATGTMVNTLTARAENRVGLSGTSASVNVRYITTVPPAPAGLNAKALSGGRVALNWRQPTTGAIAGYRVYRSTTPFTTPGAAEKIAEVTATHFEDLRKLAGVPLADGTTYYRVSALGIVGSDRPESELSNEAAAYADSTPPSFAITLTTSGTSVPAADGTLARYGRGRIDVTAEVAGSTQINGTPFCSVVTAGGFPIGVELSRMTGSNIYRGTFLLEDEAYDGPGEVRVTGWDLAGNKGTSSHHVYFDTDGPKVIAIETTPPGLYSLKASGTYPVVVTFDEPPVTGTSSPLLGYSLNISHPALQEIPAAPVPNEPAKFGFDLVLDETAGVTPETLSLALARAVDDFGNEGSRILPRHTFEVYQGALPMSGTTSKLIVTATTGGRVDMSWSAVFDASLYAIYRSTGEADPGVVTGTTAALSFKDESFTNDAGPQVDGNVAYRYGVAAIRQVPETSGTGPVRWAVVNPDEVAPAAPASLVIPANALSGAGLILQWQALGGNEDVSYAVYRWNGADPGTQQLVKATAHAVTGSPGTIECIDPAPDGTLRYYFVKAVDAAWNYSPASNTVSYSGRLLPLAQTVRIAPELKPVLTWSEPPQPDGTGTLAGYNVYIDRSAQPVNQTLISGSSVFIDHQYTGEDRIYSVEPVADAGDTAELRPRREIRLPNVSYSVNPASKLMTGLFSRIDFTIENRSRYAIQNAQLRLTATSTSPIRTFYSEPFVITSGSLGGSGTTAVSVILPGDTELASGTTLTLAASLEIRAHDQDLVMIERNIQLPVEHGSVGLEIDATSVTRGGNAYVHFTMRNPSDEVIELVAARDGGASDSNEIRFVVVDDKVSTSGSIAALATKAFRQVSGTSGNIVNLANGLVAIRLQPGDEFVSDDVAVPIPDNAPANVSIQVQIDKLHYNLGEPAPAHVEMEGVETMRSFATADTAYTAVVTSVSPGHSMGNETIIISGSAAYRDSANGVPAGVPVKVSIEVDRFVRTEEVLTDDSGAFHYAFKPLSTEAGGSYTTWASHPDVNTKAGVMAFTVGRIFLHQSSYNVVGGMNIPTEPLYVRAGTGPNAVDSDLRLEPVGQLPEGISLDPIAPIANISPNSEYVFKIQLTGTYLTGTNGAKILPNPGAFELELKSGPMGDRHNWGKVSISYQFVSNAPLLQASPTSVWTGVKRSGTDNAEPGVTEVIKLTNAGLADIDGLTIDLVDSNGALSKQEWIHIDSQRSVSSLGSGQTVPVVISIDSTDTSEGMYPFQVRVSGENISTKNIPVMVAVSASGTGVVRIQVASVLSPAVSGARVTLENDGENAKIDLPTLSGTTPVFTVSGTDTPSLESSFVEFPEVPAGHYKVRVSAPSHEPYIGSLWVRPVTTTNHQVILNFNPVTIEWSVVPVTIEDRYDVVLNLSYETSLRAPVLVLEPASVNLPLMCKGGVFKGEFTITNKGLLPAHEIKFDFNGHDAYFAYQLLAAVPPVMEPGERVRIPYIITCLQASPRGCSGAAVGLALNSSRPIDEPLFGSLYQFIANEPPPGDCFNYTRCAVLRSTERCTWDSSVVYEINHGGCSHSLRYGCNRQGKPGTGGGVFGRDASPEQWLGGPGGWGPDSVDKGSGVRTKECYPPPPPCVTGPPEPTQCEACEKCEKKEDDDDPPPPNPTCPTHYTGSEVDLLRREYQDSYTDLKVRTNAGTIPVKREWRNDRWWFNHLDAGLSVGSGVVAPESIFYGTVEYTPTDDSRTVYRSGNARIIRVTGTAGETLSYTWNKGGREFRNFDTSGRLVTFGGAGQGFASVQYDQPDGFVVVCDSNGNKVLRYEDLGQKKTIRVTALVSGTDLGTNPSITYYFNAPYTDPGSRLAYVQTPKGDLFSYFYDGAGHLTKKTDASGATLIAYDGGGYVQTVTNPNGGFKKFSYSYDAGQRQYRAEVLDSKGHTREYLYDRQGRIVRKTVNGIVKTRVMYDGRTTYITMADGSTLRRDYDEFGNMLRELRSDGSTISYAYNYRFNKVSDFVDELNVKTHYDYDSNGFLMRRTDAAGTQDQRITQFTYQNGLLMERTEPNGRRTKFEYNDTDPHTGRSTGRKTREYDPDNLAMESTWGYSWDQGVLVVTGTAPGGAVTREEFDAEDRLLFRRDAEGSISRYEYDDEGRIIWQETGATENSMGRQMTYEYDAMGNQTHVYRIGSDLQSYLQNQADYNELGQLVAEYNALNQKIAEHKYDESGRRSETHVPSGNNRYLVTSFTYDSLGRVEQIEETVDPSDGDAPRITQMAYDQRGREISRTEAWNTPEERTVARAYDKGGRLQNVTYSCVAPGATPYVTDYAYDLFGRRTSVSGDREYPRTFEYHDAKSLGETTYVIETDGNGHQVKHVYDVYGRELQTIAGLGTVDEQTVQTAYDAAGNVTKGTDGRGTRVFFHYDKLGRMTEQSVPVAASDPDLGSDWWLTAGSVFGSTQYNSDGQVRATISPLTGGSTSRLYDQFGRLSESVDQAGLRLKYYYTATDQLDRVVYPPVSTAVNQVETQMVNRYDPANSALLVATTDRAGNTTSFGYNGWMLRTSATNSMGGVTQYGYDTLGRTTAQLTLDGTTHYAYDMFNQLVKTQYPDHIGNLWESGTGARIESRTYDRYGKLETQGGAGVYPIAYEYDLAGNMTKMTDGNGSQTKWYYDAVNRNWKKEYADSTYWQYEYDDANNLVRRRDGNGVYTAYSYNKFNQVENIDYREDGQVDTRFEYDAAGRREHMIDWRAQLNGSFTTSWTYWPGSGLVQSETQGLVAKRLEYDYDLFGNRTAMRLIDTLTNGTVSETLYDYDPAGRMEQIANNNVSSVPFVYKWKDNANLVESLTASSGLVTNKTWDTMGRLLSISATTPLGAVNSFSYTYNSAGLRDTETTLGGNKTFSYDEKRQLKSGTATGIPSCVNQYDYDSIGNWLQETTLAGSRTFTPNNVNQYSSIVATSGTVSPLYDDNGNTTSEGNVSYVWDEENRLISGTTMSQRFEYVYDGLWRRVGKKVYPRTDGATPSVELSFCYDGWNPICEDDSSGSAERQYLWGLDLDQSLQNAGGIGGLLAMAVSGGTYLYTYDCNGNVVGLVRHSDNTISAEYNYEPFGEPVIVSGPYANQNPFKFSTKYEDLETGLVYFGRRFYRPGTGRWISRDPIGESGGFNEMGYVENDPVQRTDPIGLVGDYGLFFEWLIGRNGLYDLPEKNGMRQLPWEMFDTPGTAKKSLGYDWVASNKELWKKLCKEAPYGTSSVKNVGGSVRGSFFSAEHPWISGWSGEAHQDPVYNDLYIEKADWSSCTCKFSATLQMWADDISDFNPGDSFGAWREREGIFKDDWFIWLRDHTMLGHDYRVYAVTAHVMEWTEKYDKFRY